MNTVRAFKRLVARTSDIATAPAASGTPETGTVPTNNTPTQAAPGTTEPTSSIYGSATPVQAASNKEPPSHVEYPALPKLPPDITETASRHASSADDPAKHTTSQNEPTSGGEGEATSKVPPADDVRRKLGAKRQHGRSRKPDPSYTPPSLTSKIINEEFDDPEDPKPKGYLVTIAGARIIASTVEDYCACGIGGGHYLVCGHTIVSDIGDITCGTNCKAGLHVAQPFNCPECRTVVNDMLENKLTSVERENIRFHHSRNDSLAIALSVEYVSKYMPNARGNISQTLINIAMPGYGRACQIVPDEIKEPSTLADIYQEHRQTMEQKGRARHVEIKTGPFNASEKRKATAGEPETPFSANLGLQTPPITPESLTITALAEKHNKKQKTKLETHPEPITESNRGIKRDAQKNDRSSVDDNASLPTPASNKKLKTNLDTHQQPITPHTRGTKRGLGVSPVFADTFRFSKRVSHFPPKDIGEAAFLPISAGLGELARKRGQQVGADYSSKRRRSSEVLPGSQMEATFSPMDGKKRMSLPEYVAMSNDDDEL